MSAQKAAAPVRVVIADDHPMFRFGLQVALDSSPDITVVGQAETGQELLTAVHTHSPDVVLTDLQMPAMDGVTATRRLLERQPDLAVIILTMHEDDDSLQAALQAGARGYLLKGADRQQLIRSVLAAAAGDAVYGAAVSRRITEFYRNAPPPPEPPSFPELTPRERDVLDLLAAGHRNPEIAADLGLSDKTVRNHLSTILVKLHTPDRTAAVLLAREAGLGRQRQGLENPRNTTE